MPIIRRTRLCIIAYGVLHCNRRRKNHKMLAIESLREVMRNKHNWDFRCIFVWSCVYVCMAVCICVYRGV